MARDRDDDRFDDEMDDRDRPRRVDRAAARSKVAIPAVFLILFGLVSFVLGLVYLVGSAVASDAIIKGYADLFQPMIEAQPPSPQRQQQLDQIADLRKARLDTPFNLGLTLLGVVLSGLITLGGIRMKGLKSWGLAVTASVLSMTYLCATCVCFPFPFGLWSLIVLMNADVKAAFAAGGKLPVVRDDRDDRGDE
jgi:hypothetical protein